MLDTVVATNLGEFKRALDKFIEAEQATGLCYIAGMANCQETAIYSQGGSGQSC